MKSKKIVVGAVVLVSLLVFAPIFECKTLKNDEAADLSVKSTNSGTVFAHANYFVDEYKVTFDASMSFDPDGGTIEIYAWDFENDGIDDDWGETVVHYYPEIEDSEYTVALWVRDDQGNDDIRRFKVRLPGEIIVLTKKGTLKDTKVRIKDRTSGFNINAIAEIPGFTDEYDGILFKVADLDYESFGSIADAIPNVVSIEPNYPAFMLDFPNDPDYPKQWNLRMIGCPSAWEQTAGSPDVTVAVVDTGVDYNHPDLSNVIKGGIDVVEDDGDALDDCGHGTHCAGVIASRINNGIGIAGVANVDILPVKVLDAGGYGSVWDVYEGIVKSVREGADVISMSIGWLYFIEILHFGQISVGEAVCDWAFAKGVVLVAAGGNDGPGAKYTCYPAKYNSVISVGAVDENGDIPYWSSSGKHVDLYAPGVDIYSTMPTYHVFFNDYGYSKNYDYMSGTSMACPHVAGAAALTLAYAPGATNYQIKKALIDGSGSDNILDIPTTFEKPRSKNKAKESESIFLNVETDKQKYVRGEKIGISIKLKNTGTEDVTLTFPTTKTFDYNIKRGFFWSIYTYSNGKAFNPTETTITVKAEAEVEWTSEWDQTWKLFGLISLDAFPGNYNINAFVKAEEGTYKDGCSIKIGG